MSKAENLNNRLAVCPYCGQDHSTNATAEPGLKIRCKCGAVAGVEKDSRGLYLYWRAAER